MGMYLVCYLKLKAQEIFLRQFRTDVCHMFYVHFPSHLMLNKYSQPFMTCWKMDSPVQHKLFRR